MNIAKIKETANRYADIFAADEAEFKRVHEAEIAERTLLDDILIITLANLYYECKRGKFDRDTTLAEQKKIFDMYGGLE
mgnify:CR=1 FL=1